MPKAIFIYGLGFLLLLASPAQADEYRQALLDPTSSSRGQAMRYYLEQDVELVGADLIAFLRLPGDNWSTKQHIIDHLAALQQPNLVAERNALYLQLGDVRLPGFDVMVASHALIYLIKSDAPEKEQARSLIGAIIDHPDVPEYTKVHLMRYGFAQVKPENLITILQQESGELGWQYILSGRGSLEVLVRVQYESTEVALSALYAYRKLEYPHLEPQGDNIPERPKGLFIDGLIREVEQADRPRHVADKYLTILKRAAAMLALKKSIAEQIIGQGGDYAYADALKDALLELDPATDELPEGWPRWDIYADLTQDLDRGIEYQARFNSEIYLTLLHALALSLSKAPVMLVGQAVEEQGVVLIKGVVRALAYLGRAGADSLEYDSGEQNSVTVWGRRLGEAIKHVRYLPDETMVWVMEQAAANEPLALFEAGLDALVLDFREDVSLEDLKKVSQPFVSWLKRRGKGCHSAETGDAWVVRLSASGGIGGNREIIEARLRDLRQLTCTGEGINHVSAGFMLGAGLVPAVGELHSFGYRSNAPYYQRARDFLLEEGVVGDMDTIRVGVASSMANDAANRLALAAGDRFARSLFVTATPFFDGMILYPQQLTKASLSWLAHKSTDSLPSGCFERVVGAEALPTKLSGGKSQVPMAGGNPCVQGRWEREYESRRRASLEQSQADPSVVRDNRQAVVQRYLQEVLDLFGDDGFIMQQVIQFDRELSYAREYASTMQIVTAGISGIAAESQAENEVRIARLEAMLGEVDQAWMHSVEVAEEESAGGVSAKRAKKLAGGLWQQVIKPSAVLLDHLKRSVYFGDDFFD